MHNYPQWEGFEGRIWKEEVNVRDFIQKNYRPYDGDESFLAGPTDATNKLWGALQVLQKEERAKGGVLDMETEVVSGLTAYGPGYIDPELKDLEKVVGLQTDNHLVVPVDVPRCKVVNPGNGLGLDIDDSLLDLFLNQLACPIPYGIGPRCG